MKGDPKPRKDGRCARRGCTKRVDIKRNPKVDRAHAYLLLDPFCSTECCKLYFGVKGRLSSRT